MSGIYGVVLSIDGDQIKAAEWLAETETERGNADSVAGIVAAKRRGTNQPGEQFVLMTLADFVALLNGDRDHLEGECDE